jgi:CDP-diacylglycerol--glycerol-3-phosphate 3-phosphatidyltransferase/cardiolipin synthase
MRALDELRSLPNLLSVSRVALAAAFIVFARTDIRLVIVMVAMATDYLDGFVARRLGPMTRLGALLDPIADRIFVLVAISVMLFEGGLTTLGYFLMLIRDVMTAVGFVVARIMPSLRGAVFQARLPGKIVTVFQLATLLAVLLRPAATAPLLLVVAATSVWAVIDYTWYLHTVRVRT